MRFSGWPELKEAFLAKHLQATFILAPMAMALREQGVPIKIVYLGHRDGTAMMVHKDSGILRIEDLKGKKIAVPKAVTKGADGIWSVTLGPLKPDIYDYGYLVDGYPAGDIGNRLNYVEVPGDGPAYYDARDVPHGDVHLVVYNSKATDSVRYLRVYTPPGYEAGTARYPVLYLQHGGNCCESSWMEQARANLIMDNLIAAKKARPMIIVMALGARSGPSEGIGPVPSQMEGARGLGKGQTNYDPGNRFEVDLLTGIIPFIDHKYRTIADADHRALSGLSQGGIQTVTIGLRHTGVFH